MFKQIKSHLDFMIFRNFEINLKIFFYLLLFNCWSLTEISVIMFYATKIYFKIKNSIS